ncbi:MAG: glycine cleavage system protein H [Deltaproteobacteria bacterium]|nr:glycine cleavage system protein H [Deltaproteobacteria bacterium]
METPPDFPQDLYYDPRHHMWVRPVPGTQRVVVGMDPMGLDSIGELVYLTLPEAGEKVAQGGGMGTLEAEKMTGPLTSPVSGKITARNPQALKTPRLINEDPFLAGWMVELEPDDWAGESARMVSGKAVAGWVADETERMRERGWLK